MAKPTTLLSGLNRGQWGRVCHFSPIYIVDGGGGMYPHPFLYIDGGRGRGEPCQVVLNMRGTVSTVRRCIYNTHGGFLLGKNHICCAAVFNRYFLSYIIKCVYLTGGKIFLWEKSYMLICEYIYKI